MTNYVNYYHLELYLFNEVHKRYHYQGWLNHCDLHCIFIWKANRAKSKNAQKLTSQGLRYEEAAIKFSKGLYNLSTQEQRFYYVTKEWEFRLPTASAILTVLYPDEFSVFDYRVCEFDGMENYKYLADKKSENLWKGYQDYIEDVKFKTPEGLTLREKDQWLWGWSFHNDLVRDCN